jgi:hypothetical protein
VGEEPKNGKKARLSKLRDELKAYVFTKTCQ